MQTYSIGITGGIGSGKTTVCKIIEHLGYPVFYSDLVARELSNNSSHIREQICSLFGDQAYIDRVLNRAWIASQIFQDEKRRLLLNQIIHPAVYEAYNMWLSEQVTELAFNESALLVETGSYERFDRLVLVTCPVKTRIKRIMNRDGIRAEQVEARMNQQLPDQEKAKFAHYCIQNDDSDHLIPQVLDLIETLLKELNDTVPIVRKI